MLDGVGFHLHPHVKIQRLAFDRAPQQREALINACQGLLQVLFVRFPHRAHGDEVHVVDFRFQFWRIGVAGIQARGVEAGNQEAVDRFGREGHGHVDHAHAAAGIRKHAPEAAP